MRFFVSVCSGMTSLSLFIYFVVNVLHEIHMN